MFSSLSGTRNVKHLSSDYLLKCEAAGIGVARQVFTDATLTFPPAAATGASGAEASAGAAGAPEEDGEPPSGAGAGEAAEGAEAAAAEEQGEGTRE